MNKKQLVANVSQDLDIPAVLANKVISSTIRQIQEALLRGERVTLVGFGAFEVRKREARLGRNPQNGNRIKIPAANIPHFKAGKPLKLSLT